LENKANEDDDDMDSSDEDDITENSRASLPVPSHSKSDDEPTTTILLTDDGAKVLSPPASPGMIVIRLDRDWNYIGDSTYYEKPLIKLILFSHF
jgi:hypothetical protein